MYRQGLADVMPPSKNSKLLAIRDPAPSIPTRFRLFHGGAPKGGSLLPQSRDSLAYLGDYVYFSVAKGNATEYTQPHPGESARRIRDGGLFVVDARYLPKGCRVMARQDSCPFTRNLEEALFDLIDTYLCLRDLIKMGESSGVQRLRQLPEFTETIKPNYSKSVSQLTRMSGTPTWDGYACAHMVFGSIDLSVDEVRHLEAELPEQWKRHYTAEFQLHRLDEFKQRSFVDQDSTGSRTPDMSVIMVPGSVAVLPIQRQDGRRGKRPP